MVLEELLVDGRDMDRDMVATVLAPYLRIDRASGDLIPLPAWDDLPSESRVLLFLLTRRASRALGIGRGCDGASPVEIERATGIPGGSVRPALKRLLKSRTVARQVGIGYLVPNYALS